MLEAPPPALLSSLNISETAIALYAAPGHPAAPAPRLAEAGISRLGGVQQVRDLAAVWVGLNSQLLQHMISPRQYVERMAEHWPDASRLQDCNTAAFFLKAGSLP